MDRPSLYLNTQLHPSPRFRDKNKLVQFRRGPADDRWEAIFNLDGKWQMRKPYGLGTRDFDNACELARDKFTLVMAGHAVTRSYTKPEPKKPAVQYPFSVYAERAAKKLRAEAEAQRVGGKDHNFLAIARRIEGDLIPRWGATDITVLTEHDLNDWVADDYRVEDTAATNAQLRQTLSMDGSRRARVARRYGRSRR